MRLPLFFVLNVLFMATLWHMDVNHELDLQGKKKTRCVFRIAPIEAYRYSQYV